MLLLVSSGAASAASIVGTFDDTAAGTPVAQYGSIVDFTGAATTPGFLPLVTAVGPGLAHSGNQVADISNCPGSMGCEFFNARVTGSLNSFSQQLTVYVGHFAEPLNPMDTAHLVLTAYSSGHAVVGSAEATVAAGAGFQTPMSVTVAIPDSIAYFELAAPDPADSNEHIGMDDLTVDATSAQPADFNLTPAAPGISVAPGGAGVDAIAINRFNGSAGGVAFDTSGLPAGVTASFSPNPAAGGGTTLTLTATPAAAETAAGGAAFDLIANPLTPAAGGTTRVVHMHAFVSTDFTLAIEPPVSQSSLPTAAVSPCSPGHLSIRVTRKPGYAGTVALALDRALPAGVNASFDPPALGPPADGTFVSHSTLTISAGELQSFNDFEASVSGTRGQFTSSAKVRVHYVPRAIGDVAPAQGATPHSLHRGTLVTVSGTGFCSGSSVSFGGATATPESINADGTKLTVRVPRLALTAPLEILTPGTPYRTLTAPRPFAVDSIRNTAGFKFRNYPGSPPEFSDVVDAFGVDQTFIQLDLCWPFGCKVPLPIPDPLALLFTGIAHGALGDGQCFGMILASLRMQHGDLAYADFSPPGAKRVFDLATKTIRVQHGTDPARDDLYPLPTLEHRIRVLHVQQLSAQFLNYWLLAAAKNGALHNGPQLRDQLETLFHAGGFPLLSLHDGPHGHVVMPYDIEEETTPGASPGAFVIDVYDPNVQFDVSQEGLGNHTNALTRGRMHVAPDGSWRYVGDFQGGWSGGPGDIVIVPYDRIPIHPRLPTDINDTITIFAPLAAATQLTAAPDAAGKHLNAFPAMQGNGRSRPILLAETPGAHAVTFRGGGGIVALGPNFGARLETSAGSLRVNRQTSTASFTGLVASEPLRVQLITRAGAVERLVEVQTTAAPGQPDQLRLAPTPKGQLTWHHSGPARLFTLRLQASDARTPLTTFMSQPLAIGAGESLTMSAMEWRHLDRTSLPVTVRTANGTTRRIDLTNRLRHAAPDVAIEAVHARTSRAASRLEITTRLGELARGSGVTIAWLVRSGRHIVATHSILIRATPGRSSTRHDAWRWKTRRRGTFTFSAHVIAVTQTAALTGSTLRVHSMTFRRP